MRAVLTVASLGPRALRERLAGAGIDLRTGPFVTRLRSRIPAVAENVALLYADYPLGNPDGIADFHIELARSPGLRGWLRPQVEFMYNGESAFEPLPLAHAFPMLEWGMNWCISNHVNNHLVIHAAVAERNGRAVILPAPPGSGKSTLCAALVHNGWRLLSDELALVRIDNGMLVAVPRPVSLKNASISIVRGYIPGTTMSAPVDATSKGTVAHLKAPACSVVRADEQAMPAWVIFPKYVQDSPALLEPVPRAAAFTRLAENAFNYSVLGAAGFEALAGVIQRCASYTFTYSKLDDALATFAALEPVSP
jgi:hypothetical protein